MFRLGAIVSLCYVPGVTGAYIATQWPVLAVVLSFGLLRSGPVTPFHWLGLIFVACATAQMFFTPTPYASVFGLWLIYIMALSVWFGTVLTDVRKLYAGLALGAAVSSVVAVLQYFDVNLVSTVTTEPAGIYVNRVQLGAVLALVVVALVSERMWLWALPLLPGIAVSGSRGAMLALAVGLVGCYVRRTWLLAIAGLAMVYALLSLAVSDQIRVLIWGTAWQNLTLFGWGPGVFYNILIPRDGALFYPEYAHNDALQLFFEYGIFAAIPFAIFAFALCRTANREWPVVLSFVAAGCYSMPLYMPIASFLALVAVGRILRSYAVVRDNGDRSGRYVASWWRAATGASFEAVPVAPHYSRKG